MKYLRVMWYWVYLVLMLVVSPLQAANQTADTSPIYSEASIPFRISVEKMNYQLPFGVHSGVLGQYQNFSVIFGGRLNGLHGFTDVGSFPINGQNTTVLVLDPSTGVVYSRDLREASSGLSREQIEMLSVTDAEYYQENNTLYMVGGYGFSTSDAAYKTFPVLTALYLPGIVEWVKEGKGSFVQHISQVFDPTFQICGGDLIKIGNVMNLVFGQNFIGEYNGNSNGIYSQQIRRFFINPQANKLSVQILPSVPGVPDSNFRRRDHNVMPALFGLGSALEYGLIAFSGVFTESGGIWNVPVVMRGSGEPQMSDPNNAGTFKQSMNVYSSPFISFYSRKAREMYYLILGGMTYQYYDNNVLVSDEEVPFTNQVVTIKMSSQGSFSQHLMSAQYPFIPADAGVGYWFFGASAYFLPNPKLSQYVNHVMNLDAIRGPMVIGYVVGGIQSMVYNTTDELTETAASPYIFRVTLTPSIP